MTLSALAFLVGGLVLLVVGGSLLVSAASRLATALGVPPVVVGLTVVAFGTSAPEFAVSLRAVAEGRGGVAFGNVIGSNIFNVLFILGLAATIAPLSVAQQFVRREVPLLILLSGITWALAADGAVGRLEGAGLVAALATYTFVSIRQARLEGNAVQSEYAAALPAPHHGPLRHAGLALIALGILVLGAGWFVDGASDVARWLGVSELVIGLTVVAPGTSLPEVVTSVVAAVRGNADIAVGNVIGSNLFNLLGVLGFTAVASGGVAVPAESLSRDLPLMTLAAVACLPILLSRHLIDRREGVCLLLGYVAYIVWLIVGSAPATP